MPNENQEQAWRARLQELKLLPSEEPTPAPGGRPGPERNAPRRDPVQSRVQGRPQEAAAREELHARKRRDRGRHLLQLAQRTMEGDASVVDDVADQVTAEVQRFAPELNDQIEQSGSYDDLEQLYREFMQAMTAQHYYQRFMASARFGMEMKKMSQSHHTFPFLIALFLALLVDATDILIAVFGVASLGIFEAVYRPFKFFVTVVLFFFLPLMGTGKTLIRVGARMFNKQIGMAIRRFLLLFFENVPFVDVVPIQSLVVLNVWRKSAHDAKEAKHKAEAVNIELKTLNEQYGQEQSRLAA